MAKAEILRLCGISKASFQRYLKAYVAGGGAQLKRLEPYRPHSALTKHRPTLEAYFQPHPPATVAEAAAKIAELTGIIRKPTQVRQYLRALGMKPMQVYNVPPKPGQAIKIESRGSCISVEAARSREMSTQRKRYSGEFKARVALDASKGHQTINELASIYGVHPSQITHWQHQLQQEVPQIFLARRATREHDQDGLQAQLYQPSDNSKSRWTG